MGIQKFYTQLKEKDNNLESSSIIRIYRRFFIVMILLLIAIFIGTQGIKGTIDQITSENEAIEGAKIKLETLTKKENFLKTANVGKLGIEAQLMNSAIPPIINLPLILATLQKLAEDNEVILGDFSISATTQTVTIIPIYQADKLSWFQFKVTLSGDLENMERFISQLGNVTPILRMEKIEYAKDATKVTINFYFQPKALTQKLTADAALSDFTKEHEKAVIDISSLEPPALEEINIATPPGAERENPFR